MKNTPFTHYHIDLGAKMVPFAGYNMPVEYKGINEEHFCVREKVGVFDVSHMGEFWVKGANALAFVQYTTSNDASVLVPGKVQYSCFPNGKGGIVDDLLVYCIDSQTYLLVVNAANIQKDWDHLAAIAPKFNITPGKELYNASDEICQLAIQGPFALKTMQKICACPIEEMEYYTFFSTWKRDNAQNPAPLIAGIPNAQNPAPLIAGIPNAQNPAPLIAGFPNAQNPAPLIAGIPNAIFSTTGYTGSGGCEVYVANEDAPALWNAIFEAGAEFGISPIGLGARDTLRLEMGYCLYGNDIDDSTSPIEAGLGWITKFSEAKGDFLDKAFLAAQKAAGVTRKLVGFEMIDRGIPRHGYEICDAQGNPIGTVTSGTMSPYLKIGVGMGYVHTPFSKAETEVFINIRSKLLKAKVVKLPFYK